MFKRLIMEDWVSVIPIIAFLLTFAAFLYFTWRAIRMSRTKRDHLANLPLEDEEPRPAKPEDSNHSPSKSQ